MLDRDPASYHSTHPAVRASQDSARHAMAGNREAWLSLFADGALLQDPVGPSGFDPRGEGYRGKRAIGRFWDDAIGKANLTIQASQRIACANYCAAVLHVTNDLGDGRKTKVDMVGIYEVNQDGKIASLRVYWDWDDLVAQLEALGVR